MDIRLKGDMDGTEAARVLRERFDIPVIYLTAHADRETLDRAKRSRPMGYMVKPFQESELQASLEMALYKYRHDRRSKDRQQHLTDVLSALILGNISVDQAEIVLLCNPAAEDLTGWTKEEAIGGPVRKLFRRADAGTGKQVDLPLDEALTQGTLAEIQNRLLITKSGEQVAIAGNIAPVRGPDGGRGGAVIMFESAHAGAGDPFLRSTAKKAGQDQILEFGRFHIIAASEPMKQLLAFAMRVARSAARPVFLLGSPAT